MIKNTLNNEVEHEQELTWGQHRILLQQLRRIMYQAKRPNDETTEENKYNLTYVHSSSPVVIGKCSTSEDGL